METIMPQSKIDEITKPEIAIPLASGSGGFFGTVLATESLSGSLLAAGLATVAGRYAVILGPTIYHKTSDVVSKMYEKFRR